MRHSRRKRRLAVWRRRVLEAEFWLLLLGAAAILGLLALLAWSAIERHDSFLRLRPLICAEGMQDRQFFIVAMASPICAVFALAAVGELLAQRDARRRGRNCQFRYFSLFALLMLAAAALILLALRC